MAFNLFGAGKKKAGNNGPQTMSATTIMDDKSAKKKASPAKVNLPKFSVAALFGQSTGTGQKLKAGVAAFAFTLLAIAVLVLKDDRETKNGTDYIAISGELRVLSQKIAKATTRALQGNGAGFSQFRDSSNSFTELLHLLTSGGEYEGRDLPPSPDTVRVELEDLSGNWQRFTRDSAFLLDQEKNLETLGREIGGITRGNSPLSVATEAFAASRGKDPIATQMLSLTQRIAKNAGALIVGDAVDAEVALALTRDVAGFREQMNNAKNSTTDADGKAKLAQVEKVFTQDLAAITGVISNMQKLIQAKQAGARLVAATDELLLAADTLEDGYKKQLGTKKTYYLALTALSLIALGILVATSKLVFQENARRAIEAEQQRLESEKQNRSNQDAILRLMNELGDLADGDLTVSATVSEDITGAIADSINYTIEELRVLVGRINDAARRVTAATESAHEDSAMLLAATERQSQEIQAAGRSVLEMARSMNQVSSHATQSAQVARQSLHAAEKGAGAVQDSIKGMNEIRGQIQETSKRIKRLGESSQEIGEIVELISDITEQTNVLALNAAIQAASAGDAGRGFTVVAEEVQRLAERSAEATKQISAIVKTIQTDTQDAVSAMEQSTQGVVEGAKLSDAAGQALSEIGQVSRNLAQLIENISTATQKQAQSATGVAENMGGILKVTEQTTAGTQKTAGVVSELASLANELKGSVAGFKVN